MGFSEGPNEFIGLTADLIQHSTNLNGWIDNEDHLDGDEELLDVREVEENINADANEFGAPNVAFDNERLKAVRRYLRDFGTIPENFIGSYYEALVAYMQGRLH